MAGDAAAARGNRKDLRLSTVLALGPGVARSVLIPGMHPRTDYRAKPSGHNGVAAIVTNFRARQLGRNAKVFPLSSIWLAKVASRIVPGTWDEVARYLRRRLSRELVFLRFVAGRAGAKVLVIQSFCLISLRT